MPRDIIDAETHASRLASLQSALTAARSRCDSAILDAETGKGSETKVRKARAQVQEIEQRIEALDRARELSIAVEAAAGEKQRQAERRRQVRAVEELAKENRAAAEDAQESLGQFLERMRRLRELGATFDAALLELVAEPRQRVVGDALRHRFDGANVVAQLQIAGVPGLYHMEDMGPIQAMHAVGQQTIASLTRERLSQALRLAKQDLAEDED